MLRLMSSSDSSGTSPSSVDSVEYAGGKPSNFWTERLTVRIESVFLT
mgnify:CR=1 FL=1